MMLISESYREQNAAKHRQSDMYGTMGERYADMLREMMRQENTSDILDYGCGKRTLERALGVAIANYDPCLPGLDAPPEPHDLVACTDVLEHIEPECLDAVLDDLLRVTKKVGFFTVHTGPANKHLPDGRNTHLTQQPWEWWEAKIRQRFDVAGYGAQKNGFLCVVRPLSAAGHSSRP